MAILLKLAKAPKGKETWTNRSCQELFLAEKDTNGSLLTMTVRTEP